MVSQKKKKGQTVSHRVHLLTTFSFWVLIILENFKNFEVKSYFWLTPVWRSRRLLLPSVPHLEKVAGWCWECWIPLPHQTYKYNMYILKVLFYALKKLQTELYLDLSITTTDWYCHIIICNENQDYVSQ